GPPDVSILRVPRDLTRPRALDAEAQLPAVQCDFVPILVIRDPDRADGLPGNLPHPVPWVEHSPRQVEIRLLKLKPESPHGRPGFDMFGPTHCSDPRLPPDRATDAARPLGRVEHPRCCSAATLGVTSRIRN